MRSRSLGKKYIQDVLFAVISLFAMASLAQAEESLPDKFKLAIGTYSLDRYDSNVSVTDTDLGAGISINPQDILGIDVESSVLRIEGYYRFSPNHALTYSWYNVDSSGEKSIEETFDWVDEDGETITIPTGARVKSRLQTDIFKIGYLWSFHHSDKVEMAVGAGLHITRLAVELDTDTTIPANSSVKKVDTSIPLPVVSLSLNYKITPKLHWFLKTEAFSLKYDNWIGSYRDTSLGMEYRAWKHLALGVAIASNSLDIEEDDPEYQLRFNNIVSGALIYVATYF